MLVDAVYIHVLDVTEKEKNTIFKNFYFNDDEERTFTQKLPYGWRKTNSGEFFQMLTGTLTLKYICYQQFLLDQNDNKLSQMIFAKLFVFNNGDGVAVVGKMDNDFKIFGDFYKFGCDHQFYELTQGQAKQEGVNHYGNCFHVMKCSICGEIQSYDSSD